LAHGSEDPVSGCLMCCVGACGGSMWTEESVHPYDWEERKRPSPAILFKGTASGI
jgi:hypothetical protein